MSAENPMLARVSLHPLFYCLHGLCYDDPDLPPKGVSMSEALTPSTDWKEQIAADEDQRFASYAQKMADIQTRKSRTYGTGRALHRKQITAARGSLQVLGDLPDFAGNGLFAVPGNHEVLVRLSNGGMDRAADKVPDIRGFALKVLGVQGESALGNGPAKSQDFILINQEKFGFAKSGEFVDFVVAVSNGNAAMLGYMFKRYGLVGGFAQLSNLVKVLGRPFGGFAAENMHSTVPIANGPYAVRYRLVPDASNGAATPGAKVDWNADFSKRLAGQALHWGLQLQPFVSETLTPIEDASVVWKTPFTTVARLTLPKQDTNSATGQALAKEAEAGVFDPWQALAAHRPLGEVQRARKVVYFASQKGRAAV